MRALWLQVCKLTRMLLIAVFLGWMAEVAYADIGTVLGTALTVTELVDAASSTVIVGDSAISECSNDSGCRAWDYKMTGFELYYYFGYNEKAFSDACVKYRGDAVLYGTALFNDDSVTCNEYGTAMAKEVSIMVSAMHVFMCRRYWEQLAEQAELLVAMLHELNSELGSSSFQLSQTSLCVQNLVNYYRTYDSVWTCDQSHAELMIRSAIATLADVTLPGYENTEGDMMCEYSCFKTCDSTEQQCTNAFEATEMCLGGTWTDNEQGIFL